MMNTKDRKRYSTHRDTSRLSPEQLADIKRRRNAGETYEDIHNDYKFVSIDTLKQAVFRRRR